MNGRMWTAEELDYMKTNYATKPIDEIIENVQHPLVSLRKKARELGVKRTIWTQANVDYLKAKYANTPAEEIAEHIGVTKTCVQQKAHLLGLKAKNKRKIVFTLEQRNWMRRNYPHISNKVCAMYLGCCMDKVRDLARDLGLVKTQEFIREARVRAGKRGADKRLAKLKTKAEVTPVPTTIKPMNITDNRGIHTLERIDWAERCCIWYKDTNLKANHNLLLARLTVVFDAVTCSVAVVLLAPAIAIGAKASAMAAAMVMINFLMLIDFN